MAELNRHCFSRPVPEPLMIPVKVSNRSGLLFDVRLQVLCWWMMCGGAGSFILTLRAAVLEITFTSHISSAHLHQQLIRSLSKLLMERYRDVISLQLTLQTVSSRTESVHVSSLHPKMHQDLH